MGCARTCFAAAPGRPQPASRAARSPQSAPAGLPTPPGPAPRPPLPPPRRVPLRRRPLPPSAMQALQNMLRLGMESGTPSDPFWAEAPPTADLDGFLQNLLSEQVGLAGLLCDPFCFRGLVPPPGPDAAETAASMQSRLALQPCGNGARRGLRPAVVGPAARAARRHARSPEVFKLLAPRRRPPRRWI